MSAPKVGDRVRVTVEGTLVDFSVHGADVALVDGYGYLDISRATSVEVLEPAPPGWWPLQAGDVITCDEGTDEVGLVAWAHALPLRILWSLGGHSDVSSYTPSSDVRLLLRDGKPYVDGAE